MRNVVSRLHDGIQLITICRPTKRNCVNHATALELISAFEQFERDPAAKVAVLHGEGGNFCAGYDLSEAASGILRDREDMIDFFKKYRFLGPTKMRLSKPLIGAVQGFAVAGGLELAAMCDLRVADSTAKFGVFCRRFGVPLIDGGTVRLPRLIGLSRAMDMILTGREIDAHTAFQWGLVNRLVGDGKVLEEAMALAKSLTELPEECMLADRRSVYHSIYDSSSHEDSFNYELEQGWKVLDKAEKGAAHFIANKDKYTTKNKKSKL